MAGIICEDADAGNFYSDPPELISSPAIDEAGAAGKEQIMWVTVDLQAHNESPQRFKSFNAWH